MWSDAVIQIKENQKVLMEELQLTTQTRVPVSIDHVVEKWHWRVEERTIEISERNSLLDVTDKWAWLIACVAKVTRKRTEIDVSWKHNHKASIEVSYYVSTKLYTAKEFQVIIRKHRSIENKLHYVRDETMWEDKSRIRVCADKFWKIRTFWLNIIRTSWTTNVKRTMDENRMCFNLILSKYSHLLI